jgi:signal transduction histidine kinase
VPDSRRCTNQTDRRESTRQADIILDFELARCFNVKMSRLVASKKFLLAGVIPFDRRLLFWVCVSAILVIASKVGADPLTNAADVLSLPAEEALKGLPVQVRGVVTAAEPTWEGRFFIQDETSGVFVENLSTNRPEVGDIVELSGVSHPGAFAPIISRPKWAKVGTAALPEARAVPIEQIMSGAEDGQRVEVIGIVRAVEPGKRNFDLDIASGGYRFHAFPITEPGLDPQSLIGARVRIKGTAAASFNAALRHLVSVVLFVPLSNDFIIEETEPLDPFDEPILPLNGIAQYRKGFLPGQRVHVKGVVTLQRPGQDLFLEDSTGGLRLKSRQLQSFVAGDVVEAVGFPGFEHYLPVVEDAVFRKTTEPAMPVWPKNVSVNEIESGLHHAGLVKLEAKLLDRTVKQSGQRTNNTPLTSTVLLLQVEDLRFTAESKSVQGPAALAGLPIGSIIEVAGVCFTESGEDKKLKSLQILLPNAKSVRLLRKPGWWTPQHLLIGLSVVLAVLVAALSWTVMVSKRNLVLNQLIREKEKAQSELQLAHDQLEERIKERTAQLKFQITARKESELQYKAVLAERTRLAQEIHDTLEQTLIGIALQLDMTSKLFQANPDNANHHLELACDLVAQSQVEVRRSVWDLRSRALEQFDLPGALVTSGKQLTDGTNIHFQVTAKGRVRPLPETVEQNLLRIAQEALTNVIKHSEATTAAIELDYGPQTVAMQIKDNGRGFQSDQCAGPGEGHFGLLGISERARRLGAEAVFESRPGVGTTLRVKVAIAQEFPELHEFQPNENTGA